MLYAHPPERSCAEHCHSKGSSRWLFFATSLSSKIKSQCYTEGLCCLGANTYICSPPPSSQIPITDPGGRRWAEPETGSTSPFLCRHFQLQGRPAPPHSPAPRGHGPLPPTSIQYATVKSNHFMDSNHTSETEGKVSV